MFPAEIDFDTHDFHLWLHFFFSIYLKLCIITIISKKNCNHKGLLEINILLDIMFQVSYIAAMQIDNIFGQLYGPLLPLMAQPNVKVLVSEVVKLTWWRRCCTMGQIEKSQRNLG